MWASAVWRECCPPWMCFRPSWFGRSMRHRWPTKEDMARWLEEYQRELEEELADVADELKRLTEQQRSA